AGCGCSRRPSDGCSHHAHRRTTPGADRRNQRVGAAVGGTDRQIERGPTSTVRVPESAAVRKLLEGRAEGYHVRKQWSVQSSSRLGVLHGARHAEWEPIVPGTFGKRVDRKGGGRLSFLEVNWRRPASCERGPLAFDAAGG